MSSNESLSDLLIDRDLYFADLDDDTRDELVALLNARLYGHAGPHDLFGLVLVLLGIRPACLVSGSRPALSPELAVEMAADHASLARCDLVGQFLDSYGIPYALVNKHGDG